MIPDDFPLFNRLAIPQHFDDAEVRLCFHLGQDAVPTLDGGRHLLSVCPVCQRPWYQAGRRHYPRLTGEQLAHLGTTLHADIHTRSTLPRALCAICSTMYLDGLFTIEVYRHASSCQHSGYHLLWERASPPYTSLVVMVGQPAGLPLRTLVSLEPETLTTSLGDVRAMLAWLETCPCPAAARLYSEEEQHLLARRLSPVNGLSRHDHDEEPRIWCGYAWRDRYRPFGEPVLVSLAVTVSPRAPAPLSALLQAWRVLARAMRTVL